MILLSVIEHIECFTEEKGREPRDSFPLFSYGSLTLLVLYVQACSVQKRHVRDFLPRTRSERVVFQDM